MCKWNSEANMSASRSQTIVILLIGLLFLGTTLIGSAKLQRRDSRDALRWVMRVFFPDKVVNSNCTVRAEEIDKALRARKVAAVADRVEQGRAGSSRAKP
jgi:hypothetical protein